MWTRSELKENAKKRFKANYWMCVVAALILSIVIGTVPTFSYNFGKNDIKKIFNNQIGHQIGLAPSTQDIEDAKEDILDAAEDIKEAINEYDEDDEFDTSITINGQEVLGLRGNGLNAENKEAVNEVIDSVVEGVNSSLSSPEKVIDRVMPIAFPIIILAIILSIIISMVGIAIDIFLKNPLETGGRQFFVENHTKNAHVNSYSYAFKKNYMNIVKIMFLRDLYTFLWTLLFFIPGIIKSYEYRMVPYLLAEDSAMDCEEAFARSKEMMMGQKWNAFVLDLSFIGWNLLSVLTCGILSVFYVSPYQHQTEAELYFALKDGGNRNPVQEAQVYDSYIEVE